MPKLLFARPPVDAVEERKIRKLAGARHAPADWIRRAQIIAMSWNGLRVPAIAAALGCSPGNAGGAGSMRTRRGGQDSAGHRLRAPVRRRLRPGVVDRRRAIGADRRTAGRARRPAASRPWPRVAATVERLLAELRGRNRWLLIFDTAERPAPVQIPVGR